MEITFDLIGKGQQWVLNKPEIKIGRESGCDVRLAAEDSAVVSRFHASIRIENETFILEDASSPNGTFLNGKRVQRAKITPGDTIRFGANGPELKVRFVPEARNNDLNSVPPTIVGAAAELFPPLMPGAATSVRQSNPMPAASSGEKTANLEMAMIERKLDGVRNLLLIAVVVSCVLALIVIYQGYLINRNQDTLAEMRRQATDAVAQFAPVLDDKLKAFDKRADEMQTAMQGLDGRIKQAENEFAERLEKDLPVTIDRYVQAKIDEVRGIRRPPSR